MVENIFLLTNCGIMNFHKPFATALYFSKYIFLFKTLFYTFNFFAFFLHIFFQEMFGAVRTSTMARKRDEEEAKPADYDPYDMLGKNIVIKYEIGTYS